MFHTYQVTGMHCGNCVGKVSAALKKVAGVNAADVSLTPPVARLELTRHVPLEELNRVLGVAGDYRLSESSGHDVASMAESPQANSEPKASLYPLVLIVAYLAGATALIAVSTGDYSAMHLMRNFMSGFFLVFSFFKLLDLRGFADAYGSYDLVARAWPGWGFAYPFVELALGVAYSLDFMPGVTNLVTLFLMLAGSVGVLKALLDKRTIRCACLGTALNLPMTTITLVEDLGMAAMAALMLVLLR